MPGINLGGFRPIRGGGLGGTPSDKALADKQRRAAMAGLDVGTPTSSRNVAMDPVRDAGGVRGNIGTLTDSTRGAQAVNPAASKLGQLSGRQLSGQARSGLTGAGLDPAALQNLRGLNTTGGLTDTGPLKEAALMQGQNAFRDFQDQILSTFAATGGLDSSASINAMLRAGQGVATDIGIRGLEADFAAQEAAAGRRLGALTPSVGEGNLRRQAFSELGGLENAFLGRNINAAQGQGNLGLGGAGLDQGAEIAAGNLGLGLLNALRPVGGTGGGIQLGGGLPSGGGSQTGRFVDPTTGRMTTGIVPQNLGNFSGQIPTGQGNINAGLGFAAGGVVPDDRDFQNFLRLHGAEAFRDGNRAPTLVPPGREVFRDLGLQALGGEEQARAVFNNPGSIHKLANIGLANLASTALKGGAPFIGPQSTVRAANRGLQRVNEAGSPTLGIVMGEPDTLLQDLKQGSNRLSEQAEFARNLRDRLGTDTVPAMLTPGEGVITPELVDQLDKAQTIGDQAKAAADIQKLLATNSGEPLGGGSEGLADGGIAGLSSLVELFKRLGLGQEERIQQAGQNAIVPLSIDRDPTGQLVPGGVPVDPSQSFPQPPPGAALAQQAPVDPGFQAPLGSDIVPTLPPRAQQAAEPAGLAPLADVGGADPDAVAQVGQFLEENRQERLAAQATADNLAANLMQMNAFHPQRDAMLQQFLLARERVANLGAAQGETQALFLEATGQELEDERQKVLQAETIRRQEVAENLAQRQLEELVKSREATQATNERRIDTEDERLRQMATSPERQAATSLLNPNATPEEQEAALLVITKGKSRDQLSKEQQLILDVYQLSGSSNREKLEAFKALGFVGAEQTGFVGGPVSPGTLPSATGGDPMRDMLLQSLLGAFEE